MFYAKAVRKPLLMASCAAVLMCASAGAASAGCATTGTSATNLATCISSYLGGTANEISGGVAIAPDASIVLAGSLANPPMVASAVTFLEGATQTAALTGALVRLAPDGRTVIAVTRLGNSATWAIEDVDISRATGDIVAVGPFGVVALNPTGTAVRWKSLNATLNPANSNSKIGNGGGATASSGRRVSVGRDGTIAVLFNKTVTLFSPTGTVLKSFSPSGVTYAEDLVVDDANKQVVVTGFSQRDGGKCKQLQVAYLRAYDYTGALKWKGYDWTQQQAASQQSSCADSRGLRVALGEDNKLYFAGESAGGNSIYRFRTRTLSELAQNAPNVSYDAFNTPYNTKSNHITYYARFHPQTGELESGQFLLARLLKGGGNTIRPRAITADANGNVYVAGVSTARFPQRDQIVKNVDGTFTVTPQSSINGKVATSYESSESGDTFLLVASPDFKTRRLTTTWTLGPNNNTVTGLATSAGTVALAMTANPSSVTAQSKLNTANPIQGQTGGGSDLFFSVFPAFGK